MNFSDILLVPQKCIVSSRMDCDISARLGEHAFAAPVCAANMPSILTFDLCKLFDKAEWFYVWHRIFGAADVSRFVQAAQDFRVVSISIGLDDSFYQLLKDIKNNNWRLDYITIDIAHSHTDKIRKFVDGYIQHLFPNAFIIVGNGCTAEWVEFLEQFEIGACKVGLGVSLSCRTRQFTGFGSETFSSLIECSGAAKKLKLISDGGLTITNNEVWIGDIAKALKYADFVMSGALFSRCVDSPAIVNGYYGNSTAIKGHNNHIEGTTVNVVTNGLTILELMKLVSDSLKSSVSYCGSQ